MMKFEEGIQQIAKLSERTRGNGGYCISVGYNPETDEIAWEGHVGDGCTRWADGFQQLTGVYDPVSAALLEDQICDAIWWLGHDVAEYSDRLAQIHC